MSTRREPVQARSRARVDAILDAADAVFLERGFDEASTNHIAAAAGTSIGSSTSSTGSYERTGAT